MNVGDLFVTIKVEMKCVRSGKHVGMSKFTIGRRDGLSPAELLRAFMAAGEMRDCKHCLEHQVVYHSSGVVSRQPPTLASRA